MTDISKRTLLLGLATVSLMPVTALAQGKTNTQPFVLAPKFSAQDQGRINRAVAYLQALNSGAGRFEQTDFKGRKTQGDWWLQRPGKIRFAYDAPYSLLVVADGKRVNMWDPRLKAFNQYPLDATPLSLFLSKQIRLDQGVIVTEVTPTTDGFRLKARDRRRDVEGSILMTFIEQGGNLTLGEWTVTDAQGKGTRLKLLTFNKNAPVKADLFVLNKPKDAK
ncbi:outer-membrane lipoprotein carrier protein LolA [Asticcacaulis sp. BYS171W]|uniref:Outer-membrane lipoprotein carrier protein LolA n=1 Tax=Asticcacaulis aquaticus TaxID=2984212 RepID=A0ABT5HT70_9CAUL|nr:outer-membrane lipoprotein carrier protein LolA [Asticcacaulis aquaticus]MDC7683045.1 outer-membrane lipoprotein carrier protein LolA [Asticcacaulis aquaticus]